MLEMKSITIKGTGWVFISALVASGGVLVGAAWWIHSNVQSIRTAWDSFEEHRSEKARVVNALRSDLGYGGMIHHFKNLVIRRDGSLVQEVQRKLVAASVELEHYAALGLTHTEKRALADIRGVLDAYGGALEEAERLVRQRETPRAIDQAVAVVDEPALAGLVTLEQELRAQTRTPSDRVSKASEINELRRELGYGGMIHEFKNYVVRQDAFRRKIVDRKLEAAFGALDRYAALGVGEAEEEALLAVRDVLEDYRVALADTERLIAPGHTPEHIDSIIKVDDRPALAGLAVLNREIAAQIQHKSRHVDDALVLVDRVVKATAWLVASLVIILIFVSVWLVRIRVLDPIHKLTHTMSRLAAGQLDTPVSDTGSHNEIGEMARAVLVFKQNAIERERAQHELAESEARYARAVSGTNDGLWDWNVVTDEDYFSPRWAEIVGYQPAELEPVAATFLELLHPEDRLRTNEAVQAHFQGHVPYDIELRLRHKGGEYVWVRARGQVLRGQDGTPVRMAGSITDIGEQKRAESEIRQLNEQLERRVEERTAELQVAQRALLRKERLAALGQLTGTVAHELRNPLGAISTSLSVIRRKSAETGLELDRSLDRAVRGIARCDRIITELLDFARAKGFAPRPAALDPWLAGLLDEQNFAPQITVRRELATNGHVVAFDPEALRRAVINIVDNACQAMLEDPAAGTEGTLSDRVLTVTSRVKEKRVEIEVADTGPGIPSDILPNILEPLYSTRAFGTGLGLPTVQQVMEAHAGGLEISSEEGRGTQAVLWLPASQTEDEECKA